jgi:uncharacterized protein (DUF58 family)
MNSSQTSARFAWLEHVPFTREGLLWLVVSAGMLVTGLLKGINLINLIACWVITLLFWNWWLARRQLRRLHAQRSLPDFIFARTPFAWRIQLANHGRKVANSFTVAEPAAAQTWFVSCAAPGQTVGLEGETTLPRRGLHTWQGLRLACGYPVGLANVVRHLELPQQLLVLPRLGSLQRGVLRHWLSQHCPTQGAVRAAARRQPTAQLEFHGLRTFRAGDSPRHIHWRTTARRGELMVREFEDLPNDNLILIVDTRTPEIPQPGDNADLERLLSLAATIVWEWCRQKGDELALAIAGMPPSLRHGISGRELALDMLQALARVHGDSIEMWPAMVDQLMKTELPDAAVLVLSLRSNLPLDDLAAHLRRPVAFVNVAQGEERPFYLDAEPALHLR